MHLFNGKLINQNFATLHITLNKLIWNIHFGTLYQHPDTHINDTTLQNIPAFSSASIGKLLVECTIEINCHLDSQNHTNAVQTICDLFEMLIKSIWLWIYSSKLFLHKILLVLDYYQYCESQHFFSSNFRYLQCSFFNL